MELKEKMNSKENESMSTIKEMSERLKAITADLGVEKEKRYERIFKFFESKIKVLRQKFCYKEYTKNNLKRLTWKLIIIIFFSFFNEGLIKFRFENWVS